MMSDQSFFENEQDIVEYPPRRIIVMHGRLSAFGNRQSRSLARKTLAIAALMSLGGCSWGPISATSSLSPAVGASSVAYSDAVGDAADRILISNILRARDYAPLNFNQLSSISGALSLSGTLGFAIPFGPGKASNAVVLGQNTVSPSVTGSTTPTFSLTPLNTQGFTLTILQPVQSSYVASLLQQNLPREIALLLFVKEIDFPESSTNMRYRYVNDPDDPHRFKAFKKLVEALVSNELKFKTIDLLDPIGPSFNLRTASSESTQTTKYTEPPNGKSTCKPATGAVASDPTSYCNQVQQTKPSPSQPKGADQTGFGLVTGPNDLQYHVGNASDKSMGQMFRAYAGQVVMCVNGPTITVGEFTYAIPPLDPMPPAPRPPHTVSPASGGANNFDGVYGHRGEQAMEQGLVHLAAFHLPPVKPVPELPDARIIQVQSVQPFAATPSPSGGPSAGTGGASGAGGGGGGSRGGGGASQSGGSSSQATMPVLQAPRISALVYGDACRADEIVLSPSPEGKFATRSEAFVHVYWRSVAEIFYYLGAILRRTEKTSEPVRIEIQADNSVASDTGELGASAVLFNLQSDGTVPAIDPKSPRVNYTRPTLAILSTLVNYASQQSTAVQTSTPLRLLPLP